MKQHYKKGLYFILFILMAVAYILKIKEPISNKDIPVRPPLVDSKSAQNGQGVVHDSIMGNIQQSLAKREYNITFDEEKETLQSPNRRQGVRAYYKPGVLTLKNRVDSIGLNFSFELVNEGIYADGQKILSPKSNAVIENLDNKLQIKHQGFAEEFVNNEEGVRQNFIIDHAPQATRELQVRLSAKGLKVKDLKNNELRFYSENRKGQVTSSLIYKDIKCWDADGDTLAATLSYEKDLVMLSVAVKDATYPVTIDPIVVNGNPANANALLESNQAGAQAGYAVSSAGDVNGDGYSDVIVGAPFFDKGESNEGVTFVYHGSASGIASNAAITLEGNQNEAQFGTSAASAGDINKDGFSDIIIGAPFYGKGESKEGVAMVFYGSASGVVNNGTILECNQPDAKFGRVVEGLGDVNGDGYSDVIVGAPMYDKEQADEGAAFIYYGSASGISPAAATILEADQASAQYGYSSAGAGDVNGDGYNDVIIGAYAYDNGQTNEGAAFIYHGSAGGVGKNPAIFFEGSQTNAQFGWSVATAGDVNGDGYSDIIVGSYLYDYGQANEGAVFIYQGSAQGIKAGALRLESNQAEARLGISVACAGDVNGDGYSDIMIGVWQYDKGESNEGEVVVHHGSANGVISTAASTLESNQADAGLGWAAKSAGDVNGDGYSDIITGANGYDKGQADEGAAFVWLGRAEGVSNAFVKVSVNQATSYTGFSVSSAGDINGDGFSDVVIGAKYFDHGEYNEGAAFIYYGSLVGIDPTKMTMLESNSKQAEFGHSVSKAGDVNGDGYGDLVIGANGYTNGETSEGAAYIFHGSVTGVAVTPSIILESNQEFATMGHSVANANDINADGYDDIIVGSILYTNGELNEGAAFIYHGSAAGITSNIAATLEGNEKEVYMGHSVSAAGDVNGDGFGDIIIGANFYEGGKGAAFVFHGSSAGILTIAAVKLSCNQEDAFMGQSVSSAGDVNGDGYSDVIVGAQSYNNGQYSEGAAFIYHGSVAGLTDVPSAILEEDKENAYFGVSVSGAGDVNGDGFSDVIVGAPYFKNGQTSEGAFFIFKGSSAGIQHAEMQFFESNLEFSNLGQSVAAAGDVNNDGYSDVLVGAPTMNKRGAAFIFYGNKSGGLQNNLRLYNSNLTTPINQTQKAKNDFGAGLYAKSFLGKNKGKLVWETKAKGQGFSKGANNVITNSTMSSGSQNAYASLGLIGTELKSVIAKQGPSTKVRVRVKYDPALALTGQVYGPWRYLPAYLLGNSSAPAPEDVVDDMSKTVKRMAGESIAGKEGESLYVYPNPVSDRLMLKSNATDQIRSVQLLTIEGRSVYRSLVPVSEIDVRHIAAGNYILLITHGDGSTNTRKVVIEK